MKALALALSLIAASAFAAPQARAEESSFRLTENWLFTLGYKLWVSNWTTTFSAFPTQGGANYQSINANGVPANIGSLSVKYKDFFLSGSVMASGRYNFPEYTDAIAIPSLNNANPAFTVHRVINATRQENDLNAGYYITPNVALTVGYKRVEQIFHVHEYGTGLATQDYTGKTFYNGVTFGVLGGAAIGGGFSLYGAGVGGYMVTTYLPKTTSDNALYEAAELGFAWKARSMPFGATLGYKAQVLRTYTQNVNYKTQYGTDFTTGYTLGINAQF
jgi:hypothetical protein